MSAAREQHPQTGSPTDVLLLRVWIEDGSVVPLRARLLTTVSGTAEVTALGMAAGADDTCALVRRWLHEVETSAQRPA